MALMLAYDLLKPLKCFSLRPIDFAFVAHVANARWPSPKAQSNLRALGESTPATPKNREFKKKKKKFSFFQSKTCIVH